jgi:hypothetical protein
MSFEDYEARWFGLMTPVFIKPLCECRKNRLDPAYQLISPYFQNILNYFFLHFLINISSLSTLTPKPPPFYYYITNTYGLRNNPAALATQHPTYQITQNIKHNKMKIKQNQRKSKHSQDHTCGEFYKHYPLSTLTLRFHHQITPTILAHLTGNL